MIVPDLFKIAENMLFSEGFENSKVLAKKMVVLYRLSREQLSKQFHYDFGLRSMKTVLVMAGDLKRQFSHIPEDLVLMRILRDANIPKVWFCIEFCLLARTPIPTSFHCIFCLFL